MGRWSQNADAVRMAVLFRFPQGGLCLLHRVVELTWSEMASACCSFTTWRGKGLPQQQRAPTIKLFKKCLFPFHTVVLRQVGSQVARSTPMFWDPNSFPIQCSAIPWGVALTCVWLELGDRLFCVPKWEDNGATKERVLINSSDRDPKVAHHCIICHWRVLSHLATSCMQWTLGNVGQLGTCAQPHVCYGDRGRTDFSKRLWHANTFALVMFLPALCGRTYPSQVLVFLEHFLLEAPILWLTVLGNGSRKTSKLWTLTPSGFRRRGSGRTGECSSCSSQRAAFPPHLCRIHFILRPDQVGTETSLHWC